MVLNNPNKVLWVMLEPKIHYFVSIKFVFNKNVEQTQPRIDEFHIPQHKLGAIIIVLV